MSLFVLNIYNYIRIPVLKNCMILSFYFVSNVICYKIINIVLICRLSVKNIRKIENEVNQCTILHILAHLFKENMNLCQHVASIVGVSPKVNYLKHILLWTLKQLNQFQSNCNWMTLRMSKIKFEFYYRNKKYMDAMANNRT